MGNNPWGIPDDEFAALDHGNRYGTVIGAAALCMALSTLMVAARLYTRHYLTNQLGLDDYLSAAGLAGMLTTGIISCVQTKYGLGAHHWDLTSLSEETMFFKLFYVMSIIYNATLLCIKLSLFFQYYRLIRDIPRYSFIYIVIMGIITSWTIAQILVLSLICIPVQGYWDPTISAKCLDPDSVVWVNSIGNIVTDIIVLLLPMPVAWRLNLKKGQKWGVIGIFGLGFLTCVVSIFRLVFFTMMTADYTRDFVPFLAWSQAEMASGLICSALITLRPLVGIVFPAFRTIKKITNGLKFYKIGGGESGLGSRRKSANLDAKLTRRPSRDPFGGSETELTRRDELDTYRSCKRKVNFRDSALDKRRSVQSMKVARTAQKHERNVTAHRHDKFLGLESGVRTIISSGDNDSMISVSSPTIDGIMVKQVWTVGDKETRGDEDDIPQVPRSP